MSDKKHNYRADRQRLEAALDSRMATTPFDAPAIKDVLPNKHATGFNAGGEARKACLLPASNSIGKLNQHNED